MLRRLLACCAVGAGLPLIGCREVDVGTHALDASSEWQLAEPPVTLRLSSSSDSLTAFQTVNSAVFTADSGVVVGNSGTGQVLLFDKRGAHLRSLGRRGSGPGEFRSISWLHMLPGDSILVYDYRSRRLTVLAPSGSYVRSLPVHIAGMPVGVHRDGAVVFAQTGNFDPRHHRGAVRDSLLLVRLSTTGTPTDTIGKYPGSQQLVFTARNATGTSYWELGHTGRAVMSIDTLVYARSDQRGLQFILPNGSQRFVSLPVASRVVSRRELRQVVDAIPEPALREAANDAARAAGGTLSAPLFTDMWSDPQGRIWLQLFPAQIPSTMVRWLIVDHSGGIIGSLWLPRNDRILAAQGNRLVHWTTDVDGNEIIFLREVNQ